jgi:hypothetical protein
MRRHRISDYVPLKGMNRQGNKELEQYITATPCPTPGCSGMLEPNAGNPTQASCPVCKHSYC